MATQAIIVQLGKPLWVPRWLMNNEKRPYFCSREQNGINYIVAKTLISDERNNIYW